MPPQCRASDRSRPHPESAGQGWNVGAADYKIQISANRGARHADAVVGVQIGEWREALQPHALPEPDVNLSIHPAPIIQP